MTQDIIEMARQAGLCDAEGRDDNSIIITDHLEVFAKLVEDAAFKRWAAQTRLVRYGEREACAMICDSIDDGNNFTAAGCAQAIRARGEA